MEFFRVQGAAGSPCPPEEVWEVRAHLSTHGLLAHQLTLGSSQVRRSFGTNCDTPGTCQGGSEEFKGSSVAYLCTHLPASPFILKFQTVYYVRFCKSLLQRSLRWC